MFSSDTISKVHPVTLWSSLCLSFLWRYDMILVIVTMSEATSFQLTFSCLPDVLLVTASYLLFIVLRRTQTILQYNDYTLGHRIGFTVIVSHNITQIHVDRLNYLPFMIEVSIWWFYVKYLSGAFRLESRAISKKITWENQLEYGANNRRCLCIGRG